MALVPLGFMQFTKLFTSCSGSDVDEASSSVGNSKPTSLSELKEVLSNTNDSNIVRILSISEYKEAALSLAIAFADDDVSNYFLDTDERATWNEAQKWDLHLCIMEYMVVAHCLKGLVTSAGDDYSCIALWYVLFHFVVPVLFAHLSIGCLLEQTWTTS